MHNFSDRFQTASDRFRTVSDPFRTVSDRLRTVSVRSWTVSNRFWIVFGPFRNVEKFRIVFRPFSDVSTPLHPSLKKKTNFNWPGLGPGPGRHEPSGPSPGQLKFVSFLQQKLETNTKTITKTNDKQNKQTRNNAEKKRTQPPRTQGNQIRVPCTRIRR